MRHIFTAVKLIPISFFLLFASNSFCAIVLPDIIASGMVLKQKSEVALWGCDKSGIGIKVITEWNKKEYKTITDERGQWKVYVKTPHAGGPYNITIEGTNRILLTDILIGEVWFISGQSNVGWSFREEKDGLEFIDSINNDNIRLFQVPRQIKERKSTSFAKPEKWKISNAKNLKNFSSMGYYFAFQLYKELNVPIGIVSSAWAGTGIESWIPYDVQNSNLQLKKSIDRWNDWQTNYKQDSIKYKNDLTKWLQDSIDGVVGKKIKFPKSLYMMNRPHCKPGVLFNGMIFPCIPYTISGLLWYQGENNVEWANEYECQLENFIDSWRNSWNLQFPVIVGQLTNFNYPSPERAAVVREAQLKMKRKKNTYVICTIDIGDSNDVHPVDKKPFGKRFAYMALDKVYGLKKIHADYPVVNQIKRKGNQIILCFSNAKNLYVKGNALNDVLIWGKDGKRVVAEAYIKGEKLILYSNDIEKPMGVSYAVDKNVIANLYNQQDLPAFPFFIELND